MSGRAETPNSKRRTPAVKRSISPRDQTSPSSSSYERCIKSYQKDVKNLKNQIQELENRISTPGEADSQLIHSFTTVQTERNKLADENAKLKKMINKTHNQSPRSDTESVLISRNSSLYSENQRLNTELQKIESKAQAVEAKNKNLLARNKELEAAYKTLSKQNQQLIKDKQENEQKQIDILSKQVNDNEEKQDLEDKIIILTKENQLLKSKNKNLTQKIAGATSPRRQNNLEQQQLEQNISELIEKFKSTKLMNSKLSNALKQQEKVIDKLKEDKKKLKSKVALLQAEVQAKPALKQTSISQKFDFDDESEIQKQLRRTQREKQILHDHIDQQDATIQKLKQELLKLKKSDMNSHLHNSYYDNTQNLTKEQENEIEHLQEVKENLTKEINDLQSRLQSNSDEFQQFQQFQQWKSNPNKQEAKISADNTLSDNVYNELKHKYKESTIKCKELEKECTNLRMLNESNEALLIEMQKQLSSSASKSQVTPSEELLKEKAKVAELSEKIRDLEQDIFDMSANNPELQASLESEKKLRKENMELEERLHILEIQLKGEDEPLIDDEERETHDLPFERGVYNRFINNERDNLRENLKENDEPSDLGVFHFADTNEEIIGFDVHFDDPVFTDDNTEENNQNSTFDENADDKNQNDRKKPDIEELRDQIFQSQKRDINLEEALNKNMHLRNQIENIQLELDLARSTSEKLNASYEFEKFEQKSKINQLQNEVESLRKQIQQKDEQNDQLQIDLSVMKDRMETSHPVIIDNEDLQENQNLHNHKTDLHNEINQLRSSLLSAEKEKSHLQEQIALLEKSKDIESLEATVSFLQEQLLSVQAQNKESTSNSIVEQLRQQVRDLEQDLYEMSNENPELQASREAEKELRKLNTELEEKVHYLEMQLKNDDQPLLNEEDREERDFPFERGIFSKFAGTEQIKRMNDQELKSSGSSDFADLMNNSEDEDDEKENVQDHKIQFMPLNDKSENEDENDDENSFGFEPLTNDIEIDANVIEKSVTIEDTIQVFDSGKGNSINTSTSSNNTNNSDSNTKANTNTTTNESDNRNSNNSNSTKNADGGGDRDEEEEDDGEPIEIIEDHNESQSEEEEETIDDLRDALERQNNELCDLRHQIRKLKEQVNDYSLKISGYESSHQQSISHIRELEEENMKLKVFHNEHNEEALMEQADDSGELAKENEILQQRLISQAKLTGEYAKVEAALGNSTMEIEQLKNEIQKQKESLITFQKENNELKRENEELRQNKTEMSTQTMSTDPILDDSKPANDSTVFSYQEMIDEKEQELSAMKLNEKTNLKIIYDLRKEVNTLKKQFESKDDEIAQLKDQLDSNQEEITAYEMNQNMFLKQIEEMRNAGASAPSVELENAKKDIIELKEINTGLAQEVEEARRELIEYQIQMKKENEASINHKTQEIEDLKQKYIKNEQSLLQSAEQAKNECTELKNSYEKLTAQKNLAEQNLNNLQATFDQVFANLQAKINQSEGEKNDTRIELNKKLTELEELTMSHQNLKEELDLMKARNTELEGLLKKHQENEDNITPTQETTVNLETTHIKENNVYNERIDELNDKIAELEQQNETLKTTLKEISENNPNVVLNVDGDNVETAQDLKDQIEELQDQCDYFESQVSSLRQEIENKEKEISKKDREKRELEIELESLKENPLTVTTASSYTPESIDKEALESLNTKLLNKNQELQSKIDKKRIKSENMKQTIHDLEEDIKSKQDLINELTTKINEKGKSNEEYDKLAEAASKSEEEFVLQINQLKLEKENLILQIDSHKNEISKKKGEIENLKDTIKDKEEKLNELNETIDGLNQDVDNLNATIELMEKSRDDQDFKLNTANQLAKGLSEKLEALTNEKNELENERTQLRQDNEHLQTQLNETTEELKIKTTRNEFLEDKQRGINHLQNDLQSQLQRAKRDKEDTKMRCEDQKRSMKMDMDKLEKENKDLRQRYARLNAEVLGNVESPQILENVMATMLKKSENSSSSNDEKIIQLRHQIEALQIESEGKDADIRNLKRENQNLQFEINDLTKQLNEWKGEKALFDLQHPDTFTQF